MHPVTVVLGMNHSALMNDGTQLPWIVTSRDLQGTISHADAVTMVAHLVATFIANGTSGPPPHDVYFKPLVSAFVDLEANYAFTGTDEEHGSSPLAGAAQKIIASPLPSPTQKFVLLESEARMLTDAKFVPPYYRRVHSPSATVSGDNIASHVIVQQRYIPITLEEAQYGENASAVILEERLAQLTAFNDTGYTPVSPHEIGAKFVSRQKIFEIGRHYCHLGSLEPMFCIKGFSPPMFLQLVTVSNLISIHPCQLVSEETMDSPTSGFSPLSAQVSTRANNNNKLPHNNIRMSNTPFFFRVQDLNP